jgi:hypothetical protein
MSQKETQAQKIARLEQELKALKTASNGGRKTKTAWNTVVSVKSPLRAIGIAKDSPAFKFLASVDKLPVGAKVEVPNDCSKALNKVFGQSSFSGDWNKDSREMVYTRRDSKSGATKADGVKFVVHVPENGSRTVTRLA